MAIEKFYDALNSNNYNKEELGRLVFRLEPNGPKYKVIPGDKYFTPKEYCAKLFIAKAQKTNVIKIFFMLI